MKNKEFHNKLIDYYNQNNIKDANRLIMKELGSIFLKNRNDFVDLLNESDIIAYDTMSDDELVDLYVNNIDKNEKLRLGTALLINMNNKLVSFDGEEEIDSDSFKVTAYILDDYFGAEGTMQTAEDYDAPTIGGTMASSEEYSYAGLGTAIAGAVQGVAGATKTIAEGQQKKKYGALDIASKKQEAKSQITQQIIAKKIAESERVKKEEEQKQKTKRTLFITGGVILGIAVLGLTIYLVNKSRKK
jgi:hypothetical protein